MYIKAESWAVGHFHPKCESAVSFYACLDGYRMPGWWFGTFFFLHILGIIIPTDEVIFFRGVEATNQMI